MDELHWKGKAEMKKVQIITDGSCIGNPGPGGWACIMRCGSEERELSGSEAQTTNNRMELTAAINGLRALHERCEVEVVTDSQYLKHKEAQGLLLLLACLDQGSLRQRPAPLILFRLQFSNASLNSSSLQFSSEPAQACR